MTHSISTRLYWAELEADSPEGRREERTTEPREMTGYWRLEASKMKPDFPVMIWTEADEGKNPSGATIFQIGNKVRNTIEHADEWEDFTRTSWLKCVAVKRDDYATAMSTGFWPSDNKPARHMSTDEKLGIDVKPGDNYAPPEEALADQIATLTAKIEATSVADQESADAASGLLDRMRRLLELAEAERVKEKEPHLTAGRLVDSKWEKIRDPGKSAGAKLKAARDAWLKKEQARLDAIAAEENRKRQAEAEADAERERERLRKEAENTGQIVDEQEIEQRVAAVVETPPEVVPEKAKASSDFGRATSAKKVKRAEIVDMAKLVAHFMNPENPDEGFAAYMQDRANKAMRGKITLPGVQIVEE